MRARLKVDGLPEALARLEAMNERSRHVEIPLRYQQTLDDLTAGERRKFDRGGWRRDTPGWISEKRQRGLDTRTLRASGRLERALTGGRHKDLVFRAYSGVLYWGIRAGRSDLFYAQPLAKGWAGRPARRMVVIDRVARDRIAKRVQRFLADGTVA